MAEKYPDTSHPEASACMEIMLGVYDQWGREDLARWLRLQRGVLGARSLARRLRAKRFHAGA